MNDPAESAAAGGPDRGQRDVRVRGQGRGQ